MNKQEKKIPYDLIEIFKYSGSESFRLGQRSKDEEVEELKEALKECIENIECIEANVNHSEGFFSALMNATVFCEQAKQLLNKE